MPFRFSSEHSPQGDRHQAIEKLVKSLEAGNRRQTPLGVAGSGKTFPGPWPQSLKRFH